MKPFLKWVGGKRWLVKSCPELFEMPFKRLVEPFVGGGAAFFSLEPNSALLGDMNPALINMYTCIKSDWSLVVRYLKQYARDHSNDHYYEIRSAQYKSQHKRAAQFLYLNRTCWNGLYRENLEGVFNVPVGTKSSVIFEDDDFNAVSRLLRRAKFVIGDFGKTFKELQQGDLVYVDPPYTANHNNNGFIKYNENIFSWSDQERLAYEVRKASALGVKIIISNALHSSVLELYRNIGQCLGVARRSTLSGDSRFRGKTSELLVLVGFDHNHLRRVKYALAARNSLMEVDGTNVNHLVAKDEVYSKSI